MGPAWSIDSFLTAFAKAAGRKLASGLGEPEDQVRGPLEAFVNVASQELGLPAELIGEARLAEDRVRPDYAVLRLDNPLPVGFIELKAPGVGADTSRFRGRNKTQWERLASLPNVVYTDANDWVLYRSGEPVRRARLVGDIRDAELSDPDDNLAALLNDFLTWEPQAPRNAAQLVTAVAGLCRLLREEVLELAGVSVTLGALATDWRQMLFPDATDEEFADGYAQAVTFALLLARAEGISFEGRSIHDIATQLGKQHSLMGRRCRC